MTTSLILSDNELYGLITLRGDTTSASLQQLIQRICPSTCNTVDVISTLREKRLARVDGQAMTLEPLLKLIVAEACEAISFYEPEQGVYALECPNMHLLFTRYEWIKSMWRITPYKDKKSLLLSTN